jgi:hypothetical protein
MQFLFPFVTILCFHNKIHTRLTTKLRENLIVSTNIEYNITRNNEELLEMDKFILDTFVLGL